MMNATRDRDEDDYDNEIERPTKRTKYDHTPPSSDEDDNNLPPCCQSEPCLCYPTSDETWKLYSKNSEYFSEGSLYDPEEVYTSVLPSNYDEESDSCDETSNELDHGNSKKKYDKHGLPTLPHVELTEPKPCLDFSLEYYARWASYESYWAMRKAAIFFAKKASFLSKYQKAATKSEPEAKPDTRHSQTLANFKGHRYPVIRLPGFWRRAAKESKDLDVHKVSALSFMLSQGKQRKNEVRSYELGRFERPDDKEWCSDIKEERSRAMHSIWHNRRFCKKKKNPLIIARQEEIRANTFRVETQPLRSYLRWETKGGFKSGLSKGISVDDFEAEEEVAETKVEGGRSDDDDDDEEVSEMMGSKGSFKGLRG